MALVRATSFETREALRVVSIAANVATVRSGHDTLRVDLVTGIATPAAGVPAPRNLEPDLMVLARDTARRARELGIAADAVPIALALETGGVLVTVRDARVGPTRTILTRGSRSTELPGEPHDLVADGELAAVRTSSGLFVANVGAEALVSVGFEAGETIVLAAHGDLAVLATEHALHVVGRDGGWVRLPSPAVPDEVSIGETHVVVVSGCRLFAIDRATLPRPGPERPRDASLAIAPRADARSDDTVCVVRTAFQKFVALTEVRTQRHFNVTLRDVAEARRFAQGERVYVIGERLVKESELPPGCGTPEPRVLAASSLGPVLPLAPAPAPKIPVDPAATELPGLQEVTGFAPDPLFERFLSASRDEWCWPLGAFTPTPGHVDLGAGVDPCFVILFDEQSGDYTGLYDYPPARAEGRGFVHYSHDGDGLTWLGRTFGEALAVVLTEQARFSAGAVLTLLRGMSLPVTFLDDTRRDPAPAWFEAAHPRGGSNATPDEAIAEGERRRAEGDLLGAERCFVRALHGSFEAGVRRRASRALEDVYQRLDWPFHAARVEGDEKHGRDEERAMPWPDWVIVPLKAREPAGAPRLAAALGAFEGVSSSGPHTWRLARGEAQLQVRYVDAPFPTHAAPAHVAISGGELFETTLLDTVDDAAFAALEAANAQGASEPHIAASAAARRRVYVVGVIRAVVLAIGEAGLADQVVLPLAHGHARPLRDVLGPASDPRFAIVAREAVDGAYVALDGMAMFGLPDIAVPLDGRPEREAAALTLAGSLLLRGVRPRGGDIEVRGERFAIRRLRAGQIWLEPQPGRDHAMPRYQFAFLDAAEWALGAAWQRSIAGQLSRIELLDVHGPRTLRVALTNGHGLAGRPEVLAIPPAVTNRVLYVLELVAAGLRGPVQGWDRVALPEPVGGIAGAILKPILAEPLAVLAGSRVEVFDALPITVEELAAFRRDPAAQGRWIDERYAREDCDALHARWAAVG